MTDEANNGEAVGENGQVSEPLLTGTRDPPSDDAYDDRSDGPLAGTPTSRVLLLLRENRNRRLLAELLTPEATVTTASDTDVFDDDVDLCIVDRTHLERHYDDIATRRDEANPQFFPVVLVDPGSAAADPETWRVVDEVISVPVSRAVLRVRLRNLLTRRRQSRRLLDREAELESALSELRVRDRAISEAPIGITIAGPTDDDNPLEYVNDRFCELTGYTRSTAIGRNCRFLQGSGTNEATVARIRAAIDAGEPVSADLVNYTRDGERFWNKLDIAPVHGDDGAVTHFIGFQTDITPRKLHEQRVSVLNRVLRHNLRNELNIINGYTAALSAGEECREEALSRVRASVDRLVALSEEVRHVDQVFEDISSGTAIRQVQDLFEEVTEELADRYPDVTVCLDIPDEPLHINVEGLAVGFVDYAAMLISNNTSDDKQVSIVTTHDETADVVDIVLVDNGPGLTEAEWTVVEAGYETPLEHIDRLGLWVLRWVTTTAGGELVPSDEAGGRLHVRLPIRDPST